MDDSLYKSLLKMREVNKNCIMIYIGEGKGGCTASDEFFEAIKIIKDSSFDDAVKDYQRWIGLHDRIMLVK
jgi:hypothetical protein